MRASAWIALGAVVVVAALGFLYIGTTHRDRCIKAGNTGCTILPWSGSTNGNWYGGRGGVDPNSVEVPGFKTP